MYVHHGLKKLACNPLTIKFHSVAVANSMHANMPKQPRPMLMHQTKLKGRGFLKIIHIKHGYAKVIGNVIDPTKPAILVRNGNATDRK